MRSQKTIKGRRRRSKRHLERLVGRVGDGARPKCPETGKAQFDTEGQARGALDRIANEPARGVDGKKPCRVYECPDCGGFHLTSMPKPTQ